MAAPSAAEPSSSARRHCRGGGADRNDVAAAPVVRTQAAGTNEGRSLGMGSLGSSAAEPATGLRPGGHAGLPTGFPASAAASCVRTAEAASVDNGRSLDMGSRPPAGFATAAASGAGVLAAAAGVDGAGSLDMGSRPPPGFAAGAASGAGVLAAAAGVDGASSLGMGSRPPPGFAATAAARRRISSNAAGRSMVGEPTTGWAAGCGCTRGAAAWHSFSMRTMSMFIRDSARALPCKRTAASSGTSGSMARRMHSTEP